jgi:uncharacterized protein
MNSCLYEARVMHNRLSPTPHRFHYKVFLFCLDLDEIGTLAARLHWLSHNRFNLFNFCDRDHLQLPHTAATPDTAEPADTAETPDTAPDIRRHITGYLRSQNIEIGNGRIMLVTNCRTLGHQFNPVSFYFCFDEQGNPRCAVAEVGNTFRELKPYLLGPDTLHQKTFRQKQRKYFYVSPFIDLDTWFDFDLTIPDDALKIRIDDFDSDNNRFFLSTLTGRRVPLTDANLLRSFFSIPFVTLKVITLIHWQALKLWRKKIPFHRKAEQPGLQRGVYRPFRQSRPSR